MLLIYRGLTAAFGMSFVFASYTKLKLSDATVLINTNPIWTTFLAFIFLGEKLSRKLLICCLISFVGIVLVSRPEFLFNNVYSEENN